MKAKVPQKIDFPLYSTHFHLASRSDLPGRRVVGWQSYPRSVFDAKQHAVKRRTDLRFCVENNESFLPDSVLWRKKGIFWISFHTCDAWTETLFYSELRRISNWNAFCSKFAELKCICTKLTTDFKISSREGNWFQISCIECIFLNSVTLRKQTWRSNPLCRFLGVLTNT